MKNNFGIFILLPLGVLFLPPHPASAATEISTDTAIASNTTWTKDQLKQ